MKIACLGSGKMGTALLKGFVAQGLCAPQDITISDSSPAARAAALAAIPGILEAPDNLAAALAADVVLLCVKPAGIVRCDALRVAGCSDELAGVLESWHWWLVPCMELNHTSKAETH
jgi:pyrroline-5-carboxylate reductase